MASWFAQRTNPHQPLTMKGWQWDAHAWARQTFASNFAQGGFTSVAFAPSRKEMFMGMFRRTVQPGTQTHTRRLHMLDTMPGDTSGAKKAIEAAGGRNIVQKGVSFKRFLGGPALALGFSAYTGATMQGSTAQRLGAAAGQITGLAGWEVGSKVGTSLGAVAGSVLGPVGTVVGAGVGYLAGGLAGFEAIDWVTRQGFGAADRLVDRARDRRKMSWGNPNPAFYTRQAATMRQVSLQAMNRGMMTARSALGHEGVFLHQ